jgi:hypothetical protein
MRGGVFRKNIWEGASERRNENIIVSGTLIKLVNKRGDKIK